MSESAHQQAPDVSCGPTVARGWILAAAAAIVVAGLAAYSNSFSGPFIFDDLALIEQSAGQRLWPPWHILAAPRPVVGFSLALNHRFGGLWGYHAFNLAVHLLAALTLFGIIRRTLALPSLGNSALRIPHSALALVVALLWALHPLQTESVTYIIQRMESLMGLFYLLTIYCFIRAVTPTGKTNQLPIANWYVAAVAACALGMGSKEVMVTAPFVVLLYDRTFIAGSFREALRRRWGFYLALAATWAILAHRFVEAFAPHANSAGFGMAGVSALDYAVSQPGVILHYLRQSFWPSGLCLDYGWPIAKSAGAILPGAVIIGGLLAVTVWANVAQAPSPVQDSQPGAAVPHFRPAWGFIGACFFLVLAPTSSIMPIRDLAFEHRMYLPLAAVISAAVMAAFLLASKPALRLGAIALTLAAAAALGFLTFERNKDYRSGTSIWDDAVKKQRDNARAWNYRADAYASAGKMEKALAYFNEALRLRPKYAEAYYNRASAYRELNRFDDAIRDYNQAIKIDPGFSAAFNNRGSVYASLGQPALALRDYGQAIALRPDFVLAYTNRATTYDNVGEYDHAVSDCDTALALDPDSIDAYNSRGFAYLQLQKYDPALRDYDRVLALKPDYAEARNNRAIAETHFKRYDLALRDCSRAIELKPDYLDARKNRLLIYYRMKEYRKALEDAKEFQALGGQLGPNVLKELTEAAARPNSP